MEHLLNCHGELAVILSVAGDLPLLGSWARILLARLAHGHK